MFRYGRRSSDMPMSLFNSFQMRAESRGYCHVAGDWGFSFEPCRFCLTVGGVFFLLSHPCSDSFVKRCENCKRSWEA